MNCLAEKKNILIVKGPELLSEQAIRKPKSKQPQLSSFSAREMQSFSDKIHVLK